MSAAPATLGLVDLTAVANHDVARLFDTYFAGINSRNYDAALAMYDRNGVIDTNVASQREAFKRSVSTTQDSNIRLRGIVPGTASPVVLQATVEFRSTQAAGFGPETNPGETCTVWTVTYQLTTPAPHEYRILRGKGSHAPC